MTCKQIEIEILHFVQNDKKITTMKKTTRLLLALTLLLSSATNFAQIAINTDGSAPDVSAILDVQSTTKGILLPRLTNAERDAINSPAVGLVIYNTQSETIQTYHGSLWLMINADNCGNPYYDVVNNKYYETVKIGTQCWFAENLASTKYNDGTDIRYLEEDWNQTYNGAYCWYNNDSTTYAETYGALYNGYAAQNDMLCPTGWHVPTIAEWTTLENYLIANGYNYDGTTSGNKIAKSMASGFNWNASNNTGVPGNNDYPFYRNRSGFRVLPSGWRLGGFDGTIGDVAGYWVSGWDFTFVEFFWHDANVNHQQGYPYQGGLSIRCLRD